MPGQYWSPRHFCHKCRTKTDAENTRDTTMLRRTDHLRNRRSTEKIDCGNTEVLRPHPKARWAFTVVELERGLPATNP